MHNLILGSAVALVNCLLLVWFLGPVKHPTRNGLNSAVPYLVFWLFLTLFGMGYRPIIYFENVIILIACLYWVLGRITRQSKTSRLAIASLFVLEMRLSSQIIIFANALVNGSYITTIESNLHQHIALEVGTALLFAISLLVSRTWLAETRNTAPSRLDYGAIAMLLLMSLILQIINIPYIDEAKAHAALDYRAIFMFCALTFYFGVLVLIAGMHAQKKATRLEIARVSDKLTSAYYRKQKMNDESIRRMYHDMKNHLACIASMSETEAVRAYIERIQGELERTTVQRTGNDVLDAVVADKAAEAEQAGVALRLYIDFHQGEFIDGPDVCSLFGNAIDNAIEATRNLADPKKRIVTVKSLFASGQQIIKITNFVSEPPEVRHGRLISKKGPGHGYGYESMKSCVERYGGSLEYAVHDDEFSLTAIIPHPSLG